MSVGPANGRLSTGRPAARLEHDGGRRHLVDVRVEDILREPGGLLRTEGSPGLRPPPADTPARYQQPTHPQHKPIGDDDLHPNQVRVMHLSVQGVNNIRVYYRDMPLT